MENSGVYLLLIELLDDREIEVGRLGKIEFKTGYYVYVGSGRRGLTKRIERHLRKAKRIHWHIDYLLRFSRVIEAIPIETGKSLECELAGELSEKLQPIRRFGSSDCKCPSHLFYSPSLNRLRDTISGLPDL